MNPQNGWGSERISFYKTEPKHYIAKYDKYNIIIFKNYLRAIFLNPDFFFVSVLYFF